MRRSLAESFRYAFAGFAYAWRTERNLRVHVLVAVVVIATLPLFRLRPVEAAALVLAVGLVLAAELFNTAVEVVVDHLVGREHHGAAKVAKDVAAAGVLIAVLAAVAVGGLILLPKVR